MNDKKKEYHRNYYLEHGHKYYARAEERRQERKKENPQYYMLRGAKARAKKRNLPFELTEQDIIIPEFCPALGLKLEFNTGGFKDNSPSLDRINNGLGYIKGNVQVLSYKANAMKSSATFEEVEKLYYFMKEQNA